MACQGSETQGADNDVRNVRLFRALLGVDKR
ncbi:transposase, partial [Mycobacterium tuberculosis variant bovis]